MFNKNVVTIGDRQYGRIAINKKHAGEFAYLVIQFRNGDISMEELSDFIWNNVTTDYEDDWYEDIYDKMKDDWKTLVDAISMAGLGVLVSAFNYASFVVNSLSGGYEWDKKFYGLLQMVTETAYQLMQYRAQHGQSNIPDIDTIMDRAMEIYNCPLYQWFIEMELGNTPMECDCRRLVVVAQDKNEWRWKVLDDSSAEGNAGYGSIPCKHYPLKNLEELLNDKVQELLSNATVQVSKAAVNVSNGVSTAATEIKNKAVNCYKNMGDNRDRILAERHYLYLISKEYGYPMSQQLMSIGPLSKNINAYIYKQNEYDWLTVLGGTLRWKSIRRLYKDVRDKLLAHYPEIVKSKEEYEREHGKTPEENFKHLPKIIECAKDAAIFKDIADTLNIPIPNELVNISYLDSLDKFNYFDNSGREWLQNVVNFGIGYSYISDISEDILTPIVRSNQSLLEQEGQYYSTSTDIIVEDADVIIITPEEIEVVSSYEAQGDSYNVVSSGSGALARLQGVTLNANGQGKTPMLEQKAEEIANDINYSEHTEIPSKPVSTSIGTIGIVGQGQPYKEIIREAAERHLSVNVPDETPLIQQQSKELNRPVDVAKFLMEVNKSNPMRYYNDKQINDIVRALQSGDMEGYGKFVTDYIVGYLLKASSGYRNEFLSNFNNEIRIHVKKHLSALNNVGNKGAGTSKGSSYYNDIMNS